jgi:hypothetical protein
LGVDLDLSLSMAIGILALVATVERAVVGAWAAALFSLIIFAFCAYRAYQTYAVEDKQ